MGKRSGEAIIDNFLYVIGLSAVVFLCLMFSFWANAFIFLGIMQRKITKEFWSFSAKEIIPAIVVALTFSYAVLINEHRLLNASVFLVGFLAFTYFMLRHVWRTSERQDNL